MLTGTVHSIAIISKITSADEATNCVITKGIEVTVIHIRDTLINIYREKVSVIFSPSHKCVNNYTPLLVQLNPSPL